MFDNVDFYVFRSKGSRCRFDGTVTIKRIFLICKYKLVVIHAHEIKSRRRVKFLKGFKGN